MPSGDGDFQQGMISLLERACAEAAELRRTGRLPVEKVRRLRRPNGYLTAVAETEVDMDALRGALGRSPRIAAAAEEVAALAMQGTLIDAMISDAGNFSRRQALWIDVAFPMLAEYHARRDDWGWDHDLARRVVEEWDDAQARRAEGWCRTLAPLRYLKGPDEPLEIGEGVTIRPLDDADKEGLWHTFGEDALHVVVLDVWSHVVDLRQRRPEEESSWSNETAVESVGDVLRALRLHRSGAVEAATIWTRSDPPDPFGIFAGQTLTTPDEADYSVAFDEDHASPDVPPRTRLEADDAAAIAALLAGVRAGWDDPRLALAMRRFDAAYSRPYLEDSLIDLWIAFEALVLPTGRTNLSHRAARRIAQLVGGGEAERQATFELARLSYRCRSQVVHGKASGDDLERVVDETRELARKVLAAWVLDPPPQGAELFDDDAGGGT